MIAATMRTARRTALVLTAFAVVLGEPAPGASAQEVDYNKAERFLTWHTSRMISGDQVQPQWLEDGARFWYRNKLGEGHEFVLVNPTSRSRTQLFDHHRLAAAMTLAADTSYVGTKLPFDEFEFVTELRSIEFTVGRGDRAGPGGGDRDDDESERPRGKRFECDIVAYSCVVAEAPPSAVPYVESPDGRWEAFSMDYDLYVRPAGGGDSIRLTTDGEEYWGYGLNKARPNQQRRPEPRRPNLSWAPDSRSLAVSRQDERDVEHMHYISMTPQRPRHFSQPYALPGDSIIPLPGVHVIRLDVPEMTAEAGEDGDGGDGGASMLPALANNLAVELEPRPHQVAFAGSAPDSAWSSNSEHLYVTYFTRGSKSVHLAEVDAATGQAREIVGEASSTFVELSAGARRPFSWHVTEDGNDVVWWSERDGWAHLYLFDGQGNLRNQITSGAWTAGTVFHVDEQRRQIFFTARGREPGRNLYYAHLYRVNFDGSGMTLLTPEDADHTIEWSPDGNTFVDTYSRVGTPSVSVLRSGRDGRVLVELEEADISRMVDEIGFQPAEVFSVKARDGITDIYGIIYYPPNLDEDASYPIITHIYPGPQRGSVRGWSFKSGGDDFALAQLGFVVIQLDHMGTPLRSKAFHDNYYGDFNDNGIPDHIAAIRQLAARYPFIDIERVGIYGHSGGGFATTDAMFRFPEFFKVGVAGSGNHDNRSYNIYWSEKYQGLLTEDEATGEDNYAEEANKSHAANLQGKLLLMHGDMDDNVHPGNTIQVVDELIKANKDFDLIIAPNRPHSLNEPYIVRRRWDFFVEHLLGVQPPKEYEITRPEGN